MNMERILKKKELEAWLEGLGLDREIIGPQRQGERIVFAPLASAGALVFDFGNSDMSPKEFFFPQTEALMRFGKDGDREYKAEPGLARQRALVNIRPCDARAVAMLDRVFLQDENTADPYWRDKRDKTLLVGLACNRPCEACFCTSMGGGPQDTEGLDILLTDLGEDLVLEPVTERGRNLVSLLPRATAEDLEKAGRLKAEAEESLKCGDEGISLESLDRADVLKVYDLPIWDKVFETCLNCGVCTFCCPTCHCFDIQDESKGLGPDCGRRVRNWDTCMSWLFTKHASGHNPRGTKKHRVRQRFMHKLVYMPRKIGLHGCVGCGRCVIQCPVNIDIRAIARALNEEVNS